MELDVATLSTAALVLARIAPLVLVAPLFGTMAVPLRVRAAVALALAAMIVPLQAPRVDGLSTPGLFLIAVGGEVLVGLMLGLGVRILFVGMQLVGQAISQASGLQLGEVVSPGSSEGAPVFSQLLLCLGAAVFLMIGGHRRAIEALLDTFAWLPAGQGAIAPSAVEAVTELIARSFELGVRAAAPAIVALLLATLIVGLLGRVVPQLNTLSLGMGVSVVVALVAVAVSLAGICAIFQDQVEPVLELALHAVKPHP